jgi:hypothetical protein
VEWRVKKVESVRIGATEAEVLAIMGRPEMSAAQSFFGDCPSGAQKCYEWSVHRFLAPSTRSWHTCRRENEKRENSAPPNKQLHRMPTAALLCSESLCFIASRSAPVNCRPLDAMSELTKSEKKAVRELLGEAHEAEIASALIKVEEALREWRRGEILPSEVSERIHAVHKETQEIFKTYNYLDPLLAVARAVTFEFIKLANVPDSLQARVIELETLVRRSGG